MAELLILLAVVGVIVAAVAWPLLRSRSQGRRPSGQAPVERGPVPPRRPDTPVPGSQVDRERKGRR
jgi:hypothetical protein